MARLVQIARKADALVEDKAGTAEMSTTAFFEVPQNASVELEDRFESVSYQEWSRQKVTMGRA
jgi:hypothetical protein